MAPTTSEGGEIGARLRAARARLGWTREELAFHSGLSWSAIAQVESGRRTNLRPSTLSALSEALGVTIDYLVSGSPSHAPMLEHSAYLYSADDAYRETMGSFLAEGLERSEAVMAVTTSGNLELLREHLGADAERVELVDATDWFTTPPAALEGFTSFSETRLRGGAPWVRVLAEPIWSPGSESELRLWTRFESLVNVAFGSSPATFVCPYDVRSVAPEIVSSARLTHPKLFGDAES
jgi:transcriptional regulator with XRE-family HTH domain